MKRSLTLILLLAGTVAIIYSCSKNKEASSRPDTIGAARAANNASITEVRCVGSCKDNRSCGLEGMLGGPGEYVQCDCDNCSMEVTTTAYTAFDTTVTTTPLPEGRKKVYALQTFIDYMKTTYPGQSYKMTSVKTREEKDYYESTYTYILADGTRSSVMFKGVPRL